MVISLSDTTRYEGFRHGRAPDPALDLARHRPQESAGRLVNCYAEPKGEETGFKIIRAPGLTSFATVTGVTGFRGMFLSVATLYLAYGDTLFRVGSGGGPLTLIGGGFTGTGPVQFAANNRSPTPDKVAVTANGAFTFTDTLIATYPDSICRCRRGSR